MAGQVAENLYISPAAEKVGPTSAATPEPDMPASTPPPPPPPQAMVPQPSVEDPFAEVIREKGSKATGTTSHGSDPQEFNNQQGQAEFDAFPAGGDGFENGTDPFATNGLEEGAAGDPFTATDAVFTNATAAADGFDAFPADTQQVDAFGQ